VNKLLDEIKKVAGRREIIIGGDFNLTVSNWTGPERPTCKQDSAIQARLADESGCSTAGNRRTPPALAPDASVDRESTHLVSLRRPFRAKGMEGPASVLLSSGWRRMESSQRSQPGRGVLHLISYPWHRSTI